MAGRRRVDSCARRVVSRRRVASVIAVVSLVAGLAAGAGRTPARADGSLASTPTIPDASSAPDERTAQQIAQAYGHPVVVDTATSETEQVAAQPDGTMELTVTAEPVRVRRPGRWVAVDTSLVADSDGLVSPVATAVPARFSGGGSGPLAQVQAPSGEWLSEMWTAGPLPTPTIAGDTATYAEVFAGVDLKLMAHASGMSEVLVVKSPAAAANPALADVRLRINGGGLTTTAGPNGSVDAAADGSVQLHAGSATWWDSSVPGADQDGPGDAGVARPAPTSSTSTSVSVDVAQAASTADVQFPVYVDPDWTGNDLGWTYVDKTYPTESYWRGSGNNDAYAHVGFINAANAWDDHRDHTARAFWRMDTRAIKRKQILVAHFDVVEVYSSSCQARPVQLWTTHHITSTTSWNTQPDWMTQQDTRSIGYGHDSSCPGHTVGFDALQGARYAADNSLDNLTFALKASDEGDWLSWKKFDGNSAQLRIQYNSRPNIPALLKVAFPNLPCATTGTVPAANNHVQGIKLQATLVDHDGDNVAAHFEVVKSGDPNTVYFSQSTRAQAPGIQVITLPKDKLPNGASVSWHAYAGDGHATSDWSVWCHLTIDNTRPPAPAVTTTAFGSPPDSEDPDDPGSQLGSVGVPGAVTVTAGPDTVRYQWSPNDDLPAPPGATLPACGMTADVTTICVSAGQSATINFEPLEEQSVLYVQAFDKAGNRSAQAQPIFWVHPVDLLELGHHFWQTDGIPDAPAAVADDAAADPAAALQLSPAGSGWISDGPMKDSQLGGPSLMFDGSGSAQAPAQLPVDAASSVTMMAWVYPTRGGVTQTFLSEDGANISAFSLLLGSQNEWKLCLPTTSQAAWEIDCATGPAALLNHWSFVAGMWDAASKRIRLYVNDAVDPTVVDKAASTPHVMAAPSTGDVVVGRGQVGGPTMNWHGRVNNPAIYPGILDEAQLNRMLLSLRPPACGEC